MSLKSKPMRKQQEENATLRNLVMVSNTEIVTLRRKVQRLRGRVAELESLEFNEKDLRSILFSQKQLHDEIRRGRSLPDHSPSAVMEEKFLQLQMMMPEIIQRWKDDRKILVHNGTQTKIETKSVITSTADDKKDVGSGVTLDSTEKVADDTWKAMSKHRRQRLRRRLALEREYDPARPSFLSTPRQSPIKEAPTNAVLKPT